MKYLSYKIKLLSPVLFSVRGGDLNTVDSFKYIPGSAIRGVLASLFIKEKKLGKNAHEDEEFYNLFLENSIFTNAYIILENCEAIPTPLSLLKEKDSKKECYNLLELDESNLDTEKKYKSPGTFISVKNNEIHSIKVKTIRNFHHSREGDRIRGHSIEGKIFYFEAIEKDQKFQGKIIGSDVVLNKLKTIIDKENIFRLGRSKTAQYGHVRITAEEISEFQELKNIPKEFNFTFTSPIMINNEFGVSTVSAENFKKYLQNLGISVDIKKSYIKAKRVSNYVSVKHCKEPEEWAYKEGSSFRISVDDPSNTYEILKKLYIQGMGNKTIDGFGRFEIDQIKGSNFSLSESKNKSLPINNNLDWQNVPIHIKKIIIETIENAIVSNVMDLAIKDYDKFKKYMNKGEIITKSLAGRIELILMKSNDINAFINKIQQFRDQAIYQLERCKNERTTLEKVLKSKHPENILDIPEELKDIAAKIGFKVDNFKYYKKYWQTFISLIRKAKKAEGKNDK